MYFNLRLYGFNLSEYTCFDRCKAMDRTSQGKTLFIQYKIAKIELLQKQFFIRIYFFLITAYYLKKN